MSERMNDEERMRMHDQKPVTESEDERMREVEMRTTPGHDPSIEDMTRAPASEGRHDPGPRETGEERGAPVHEPAARAYDRGEPHTDGMGGMDAYRNRLADAQSRFIDDPKGAVEEARSVVEEAVDRFMDSLRRDVDGEGDTESMRLAMQRCRDLLDRLAETPS